MSWYLRSLDDHDTHHVAVSLLRQGTVTADCGLEFQPIVLPTSRLVLRGGPADPRQVRPKMRRSRPDEL